jgi:1-acyl-sn-glycerol-3-phosphate acyltransferase
MQTMEKKIKKLLWILYQPYKWLIYAPLVVFLTLVFGTLAATLVFIVNPGTASALSGVPWARLIAFITPIFVTVTGRENIDRSQSYVIVSNHQSQYDILLIYGRLGVDFRWVMKKELRKIPALGIACERLGHIFIDRSNPMSAVASLKAAKIKIVNGTSVMFFPEGTRSKDGSIGIFKKGAFKMALDLGIPVLPITIIGTKDILPSHSLNVFPGKVKMIIHKPVEVTEYNDESLQALMQKIREIIISSTIN